MLAMREQARVTSMRSATAVCLTPVNELQEMLMQYGMLEAR
jgi:hypothetical protein